MAYTLQNVRRWARTARGWSNVDLGMVSCLCVTRGRYRHVKRMLSCFKAQTYRRCQLVLVYEELEPTAAKLLASPDPFITLVHVPSIPKQPIGRLRNISIRASRGGYLCCWDDDDWHSPFRVERQLGRLLESKAEACMLNRITVLDERAGRAYVSHSRFWESTLLCRRDLRMLSDGYPEIAEHEDTPLCDRIRSHHRVAGLDEPELFVYTYHGGNNCSHAHFVSLFCAGNELSNSEARRIARELSA
jgi:glycosyltransferase involved in cell wall biosynthesis